MRRLTFEKFCLVSSLAFLGLVMMGSSAQASPLQDAIISPIGFKIQAMTLILLYLAVKLVSVGPRHF